MTERLLGGRCNCGAVHYRVADAFEYSAMCHCTDCQRRTGSAFKPFAGIPVRQLEIISGEDQAVRRGNSVDFDVQCSVCGSLLYSVVRDGAYVHVAMGTLVDAPGIRPSEHIFVGSKADWETITDDLPQYARHSFEGPPINSGK